MSSKAITEKSEPGPRPSGWESRREVAPSLLREDEATFPRYLGMFGGALVIFGGMALAFNLTGKPVRVGTGWATLLLSVGLAGLLFHAAFDRDVQVRRMYMAFSYALLAVGAGLFFYPYLTTTTNPTGRLGVPCLVLALLFFLAWLRNESDALLRNVGERTLGAAGALLAIVGLLGGTIRGEFLLPGGLVLALLGLVYLATFVRVRGVNDDLAYWAGVAVGLAGAAVAGIALVRSLVPGAGGSPYFIPYGVALIFLGALYGAAGWMLCSDSALATLTRRELGAFFFSPMAYLVFLGFGFVSWLSFLAFIKDLTERAGPPPIEPIVRNYLFALFPVLALLAIVPILTMRLLSEEQRTGTLEVLLTAPVGEAAVVLSKFVAALLTYLFMWLPFGLYLLAIPLGGGNPFDYRPLFSFFVGLAVTGAGFVAMGLFFSSLTRSQVASGVLTFAGMLALTYCYIASIQVREGGAWETVFTHMSYLHIWNNTLEGRLVPRQLLFYLSLTVLGLFVTVKVLESRKWR
jgi:ABC-2 type transport system permease protein